MHFFYICPSGNFHRDFLAYLFSICPKNTRKRARKRECSTHGNIPSFIMYLFFQFCQFIAVHIRCMTALTMAC